MILITNGVYQTGGHTINGYALTNRVVIDKPVMVQSVNGPTATFIRGYQMPGTINGSSAVRCVYMADNAALSGFTLTGGATSNLVDVLSPQDESGGGIWCESSNAIISNCVITANSCCWYGAGAYSGTLNNCQVLNNTNLNGSLGGGGGAAFSLLFNCTILGNRMQSHGGGVFSCALSNCVLAGNSDAGAYGSILEDCTISSNSGVYAGGADQSTLTNCLLCNNQGQYGGGAYDCVLDFCTVSNNQASGFGGGVYYDYQQTNALGQNNLVIYNRATNFSTCAGGGVFLGTGASPNGWTFISNSAAGDGGGLYDPAPSTNLNNCTFWGNSSGGNGGGFSGALTPAFNCTFIGNIATGNGGGAYSAALTTCFVSGNRATNGGGVYGVVNNCIVNDNVAANDGGGLYYYYNGPFPYPAVTNCAFTNNSALNGGGVYAVSSSSFGISNCVFWANSATNSGGGIVLGSQNQHLDHCIIVSNYAGVTGGGGVSGVLSYCTVSRNNRYQTPVSRISYAWLQQYGLPINTSTDTSDPDGDGLNNYQEWIAGTIPTNALSVLEMLNPAPTNNPSGLVVSWESASNITYFLQSSTNLAAQPAFSTIQSNIVGQPDTTSYMDTNASATGPFFYRVGVQQ